MTKSKLIAVIALLALLSALALVFGFMLLPSGKTSDLPVRPAEHETVESTFLEAELQLWIEENPTGEVPHPTEAAATTEAATTEKPADKPAETQAPTEEPAAGTLIRKKLISFAPDPPPVIFPFPGGGVIEGESDAEPDYSSMKNNKVTKVYTKEQLDALGEVIPIGKRIITANYETANPQQLQVFFSTLTYAKRLDGIWMTGSNAHSASDVENLGAAGYSCDIYSHKVDGLNPDLQSLDWEDVVIGYDTPLVASGGVDTPLGMFGYLKDTNIAIGKKSMRVGIPQLGDAVMITELNERGPLEIPVRIVNIYTSKSGTNMAIVETPYVIDINGSNLGVMNFFGGQSGSPIIQDGKFVAAVAFTTTYTFDGREEQYNGAVWAADMVGEHFRRFQKSASIYFLP